MKWLRKILLFYVNDDSYFKDLYVKNISGGFKEGGGWNIWCKYFSYIWLCLWKKGFYGKLFIMLFYIYVGIC